MASRKAVAEPGTPIWMVSQDVGNMSGIYLVEAVVVAKEETEAVRNVVNFCRTIKWKWNDYDEPGPVYTNPSKIKARWVGRVTVDDLSLKEGVMTFRVGKT